jgi:hypothetical protein
MFFEKESELLKFESCSVSIFRYQSGVEAIRIHAGRSEFIWLPYLGQQFWDWIIDGKSLKLEGFVKEPSYGRNFLQNYGGFLIHCGMTAMGNPGVNDTHPQHGELPIARFNEAWIEIIQEDGHEVLTVNGRLHWHIPFVAEYYCIPSVRILPDGLSLHAEVRMENPTSSIMDYMYLAHINFAFSGARELLSTAPFDSNHVVIRNEIIPGLAANPALIKHIDHTTRYEPEFVATINDQDVTDGSVGSILVHNDGTSRWVSQEVSALDHHVLWITHNADRGACGFHLPSTAGSDGFTSELGRGNIKHLMPGSNVTFRYDCGFSDKMNEVPVKGAV